MNLLLALISYIIGSFPTAYLMDNKIFYKGDKNMGAYNVLITSHSIIMSGIVLLVDVLKGVLIVIISQSLSPGPAGLIIAVTAGILGHDYSIFLNFKGGKGLAIAIGVMLLIKPLFLALMVVILIILLVLLKDYVKAGLLSIPILLIFLFLFNLPEYVIYLGIIGAVLIAHKDVIRIVKSNNKLFN
ncbi:MAG: glycerol-3-phosphate acyltransferase [Nanoarchaeota archaeon]|nr:glycerol-3-phosphate acyltransferase [Nanoarchaeota archaeon]